jgi:hypothetical protein
MAVNEKSPGVGSFNAAVNGEQFLVSDRVNFHDATADYFIYASRGNANKVSFSVPVSLEGEGPHTVNHYTGGLEWFVDIDSVSNRVVSGSTTVTFDKNRQSVEGSIEFFLKDGRKVTGKFNIKN